MTFGNADKSTVIMRQMQRGTMPKPSERAKAGFLALLPGDAGDGAITTKPMFGNLAAWVKGNMFAGLFGDDLFVRLPEAEMAEVKRGGGANFEPMPGHAMKGYVTVPPGWLENAAPAQKLVDRSLEYTRGLPAKQKKPPKRR